MPGLYDFPGFEVLVNNSDELQPDPPVGEVFDDPKDGPTTDSPGILVDSLLLVSWPKEIRKVDVHDHVDIGDVRDTPDERLEWPDDFSFSTPG